MNSNCNIIWTRIYMHPEDHLHHKNLVIALCFPKGKSSVNVMCLSNMQIVESRLCLYSCSFRVIAPLRFGCLTLVLRAISRKILVYIEMFFNCCWGKHHISYLEVFSRYSANWNLTIEELIISRFQCASIQCLTKFYFKFRLDLWQTLFFKLGKSVVYFTSTKISKIQSTVLLRYQKNVATKYLMAIVQRQHRVNTYQPNW